jgi:hypothetical protein
LYFDISVLSVTHFTTFEFVDTNTLAPGISKNETVMANPPLLALAVSVNAGC